MDYQSNANLPATVTTPNPRPGGSPQATTTPYDAMLRATNVIHCQQPSGAISILAHEPKAGHRPALLLCA